LNKKVLLDTNIIIHRESPRIINKEIGILFRWLDNLQSIKCIHPITQQEINRLNAGDTKNAFNIKLDAYNLLTAPSKLNPFVQNKCDPIDTSGNDKNDTLLINEVYNNRVDYLITEDKKLLLKASLLGIQARVFSIENFLEKVTAENPGFLDYKVLSIRQERFGQIEVSDPFFNPFRSDYPKFDDWFNRKSEEIAYVCRVNDGVFAFLYLKVEGEDENYSDISPAFTPKKRLKIGTFKVNLNGYKLGERFIKIIFDNAVNFKVDEIYVTIFNNSIERLRLINLLEEYGFYQYGNKGFQPEKELVYVRKMDRSINRINPKLSFPFISKSSRALLVPIYPSYHTELLPDSILRTESPSQFQENESHRNAISKVYISRSINKDIRPGDNIIFYRTKDDGHGYYESVITTIGIVESIILSIPNVARFIELCRKRSVFSDDELQKRWNFRQYNRPFIVNFLYVYSFPKRINLKKLIELKIIKDTSSAPRGFELITNELFQIILKESNTDESFIVD